MIEVKNLEKSFGEQKVLNDVSLVCPNGEITGRSTVSMLNTKIPNGVEKQWDENLQQYYIEYAADKNTTVKMWIEDGTSIAAKVALVTKYNLAGTSGWRKDFETSNVWSIIKTELSKSSN